MATGSEMVDDNLLERALAGEEVYLGPLILEDTPHGQLSRDMLEGHQRQFGDDAIIYRRELLDKKTQTLYTKVAHVGTWVTGEAYRAAAEAE